MSDGVERAHKLTVTRVEPNPLGDHVHLEYEIEHYPECYGDEGELTCLVDWELSNMGLAESLEYSQTPVTEAGTYQIEGWWEERQSMDGDETSSGIQLVREVSA